MKKLKLQRTKSNIEISLNQLLKPKLFQDQLAVKEYHCQQ